MKLISTVLNLVLLTGASLLMVFIVLSGSTNSFPFNTFYSVRADTSAISNAYSESDWSFWGVCDNSDMSQCRTGPAFPLSPVDNFQTIEGVPQDFIDNRDTYFYLSRFAFAFALIGLGFCVFALIVDIAALCFAAVDKVAVVLVAVAAFFIAGFAAMLTAVTVLAKNAFNQADMHATVGTKYMAMTWAAFACILLVFFNTCAANIARSYKSHIEKSQGSKNQTYYSSAPNGDNSAALGDESSFTRNNALNEKDDAEDGGIRFFRIKRNRKPADEESS